MSSDLSKLLDCAEYHEIQSMTLIGELEGLGKWMEENGKDNSVKNAKEFMKNYAEEETKKT